MVTGRFCPSRHTRASAWRSFAGFQSESNNTSRFAPTRFSPTPPALHDNRNTSPPLPSLNLFTIAPRRFGATLPSSRDDTFPPTPAALNAAAIKSSVDVNPETTTVLSTPGVVARSIVNNTASFPEKEGDSASAVASNGSSYPRGTRALRARISSSASFSSTTSPPPPPPPLANSRALLHNRWSFCNAVSGLPLPPSAPLTAAVFNRAPYSAACVGDNRTNTTYSVFGGSP
eukprot:14810-Pelagococcus_subviridis.AAC.9